MLSMYKAPNLGVMVYQLRQCAAQFSAVFESHRQYQQKLAAIHELSSEDLKQVSVVLLLQLSPRIDGMGLSVCSTVHSCVGVTRDSLSKNWSHIICSV